MQDTSGLSKARARQHAAIVVHRRKRLANYQKASQPRLEGDANLGEEERDLEGGRWKLRMV